MQIKGKGRDQLLQIADLRVHGKFIKDGKATLTFLSAGDDKGIKRRVLIR